MTVVGLSWSNSSSSMFVLATRAIFLPWYWWNTARFVPEGFKS